MQSIVKMRWFIFAGTAAALLVAALMIFRTPHVSAHEGRAIGPYEIAFGWQVEPAYVGVYNGPEVFINIKGATEEEDQPVVGAEKTLKLKVTFGKASKELTLEPAYNDPGHYLAHLIPTRPGDYTFQLTGTISPTGAISGTEAITDTAAVSGTAAISGTAVLTPTVVNETFTSANGEFSSVEPASDVLFPDDKLDAVALQAQVDALQAQVDALKKDLDTLKAAKK